MIITFQSANRLIPNLFMKAADDVKLSLILDCLPKLSVEKILKDLNESEKEVNICHECCTNEYHDNFLTGKEGQCSKDDPEPNVP